MRLFISIIFAFYANAGFALSLGEATLKSYLGESLTVKLSVTDVEKSPDISCFTITDTNDVPAFKRAFSTVSPQKEGYLLTITTQSVISEPILSLRVSYHCEPQLHRDYVLLLDPAAIQNETASSNAAVSPATAAAKHSNKKSKPTSRADTSSTDNGATNYAADDASDYAPPAKAKRKSKKHHASTTSSADDKIMEAYVGKQQNSTKQTPATSEPSASVKPDTASKPYLSISGGSLTTDASGVQHNLSLQFETQLDLNRAPPTTAPSSIDLQDEATMMSNRLAHLEKQIINLQAQNTLLKNEAEQAKNALAEQQSSWSNYAWMIAVAVLVLAALEWLRRTIITRRLIKQEQNWFEAEQDLDNESALLTAPMQPVTDYKVGNQSNATNSFFDDDSDDEDTPVQSTKSGILTPAENVNDEHDSIIDNADVFIEHERPQLAIQLLQNHLNDFPTESPKVWLKLLSLLAKEGQEAEYTATVVEANKYFNIKAPDFSDANNEDTSSIEDFSNIVARLEGAWGSPFAVKFLNDLIYDKYAQPPEGFSACNFEELFFLKRIAELLNTGIAANQHTLHRNITTKAESSSPARSVLDHSAFNSAAFNSDALNDDNTFDNATAGEYATKPRASTMSEADFTVASLPDMPEQAVWSRPTQEEMNAQFVNSPFQKVPSYEVDMLADFDDHIAAATAPTFGHAAEELTMPTEVKTEPAEMAEEFLFPLDIYADETAPAKAPTDEADNQAPSNKSKDSNIIEWDLPKSNK